MEEVDLKKLFLKEVLNLLDTILKGIKEKGFEIVPISQLIHRENFEMDHEGRQIPKGKDV